MIMSTTFAPLLAKCLTAGAAALQLACSSPDTGKKPKAVTEIKAAGNAQHGIASIYTDHRTASGERYSRHAMAGAHKTFPLGCKCRVTNLRNDKSVIIRINDRGPYIRGRIVDLTPAAAEKIGLCKAQGITKVKVERL